MPTMRVGATTQRFFEEGEQHEAAEWQDTVLPPDDAPEADPEVQFDSFDKIPKKRSPLMTMAAIGGCLLIGSAAWAMAFGILRTGHSIRDSVRALTHMGASQTVSSKPISTNTPGTNSADGVKATTPAGAAGVQPAAGSAGSADQTPDDNAPSTAPAAGPLVVPMAPSNSAPPTTPPTIAAKASGSSSGSVSGALTGQRAARNRVTSVIELTSGPPLPDTQQLASGTSRLPDTAQQNVVSTGPRGMTAAGVGSASPDPGLVDPNPDVNGNGNSVKPSRSPDEGAARLPGQGSGTPGREDRTPPLRGYVWSPSAKALVPAEPSSLPTTDPDLAATPAPSSPAASSRTPSVPSEASGQSSSASPAVAPAVAPHGVVAPPTVGSSPAERPAPIGSEGAQIVPPPFSPR